MFRFHPRAGASALTLGVGLSMLTNWAEAQTTLPSVTVDAPQAARAKPARSKPKTRAVAARRPTRPLAPLAVAAAGRAQRVTPSAARDSLNQGPAGQTQT